MNEADKISSKAEVKSTSVTLVIKHNTNGEIIDQIEGIRIGAVKDTKVLWKQEIFPVYVGLKRLGVTVKRRRFAERVAKAEQKARQRVAAENLNNNH